jgi:AraC family transcriptional regulator
MRRSFLESLNATLETPERSVASHLSRAQTSRLFADLMGESPAAFRKRLRLERAAWQLSRTTATVTDIGFDAGFSRLEVFSRAFKAAFGISPSQYRRNREQGFTLRAPNHIHWYPKGNDMDLLEIMLGHDEDATHRMLEAARGLSDAQLDAPLRPHAPLNFEPPQTSLRQMFDRLVAWKEVWLGAIQGTAYPTDTEQTLSSIATRFSRVAPAFQSMARGVRDTNNWRGAFVDHLCEPPEVFTLGGVIAHILTFSAQQRGVMLEVMSGFGINNLGASDPIEYVRRQQEHLERQEHP